MFAESKFQKKELSQLALEFAEEIQKASKNLPSKISFDSNKIEKFTAIETQKPFQILYLGGSHIESAIVQKRHDGKTIILKKEDFELQKINSAQEFYDLICSKINPEIDYLLLNIAANLKLVSDSKKVDSILQKNHRIHNLSELVGRRVGLELESQIQQKLGKTVQVSAVNNLVSLGALIKQSQDNFGTTIAGVVATGINFGFFQSQASFINLEAGKWKIDGNQISDLASQKAIIRSYNQQAKKVNLNEISSFSDLQKISKKPEESPEFKILESLILESTRLVAAQIAGVYFYKTEQLKKSNLKLKFLLEGSLFWDLPGYKKLVQQNLENLGFGSDKVKFARVRFGFILGSAKLFQVQVILEEKRFLVAQKLFKFNSVFAWFSLAPPASV